MWVHNKEKILYLVAIATALLFALGSIAWQSRGGTAREITINGFQIQLELKTVLDQGDHSFEIDELAEKMPDLFTETDDDLSLTVSPPEISFIAQIEAVSANTEDINIPMPGSDTAVISEGENLLFGNITFIEPGVFTHRISIKADTDEQEKTSWVLDESVFYATVTVSEDQDRNRLTATIYTEEEISFTKKYQHDIREELEAILSSVRSQTIPPTSGSQTISPTFIRGILLVNKHHPLPRSWAPGNNPRALAQVNALIAEMRGLGFNICTSFSGFRSFEHQERLFNNFVATHGRREAERFSARPGHSEHQSGLAFDLKHRDGRLIVDSREITWVAENAHRFGFIVRYPAGREHITGFMHEPWHLRYIGRYASQIRSSGLTLEEFLGAGPAPNYLD